MKGQRSEGEFKGLRGRGQAVCGVHSEAASASVGVGQKLGGDR